MEVLSVDPSLESRDSSGYRLDRLFGGRQFL
jgi:hypothetical protein